MSAEGQMRGAAPVAYLGELSEIEAGVVICLRLWCEDVGARNTMWNGLARELGPERGRETLKAFERLFALMLEHGRRPIMRHGMHCHCVGADEAVLANLVSTAAGGDLEEAILISTLIVRADFAHVLAEQACRLGLGLRAMKRRWSLGTMSADAHDRHIH